MTLLRLGWREAVTARASTDTARDIPEATVARLPVYLRALTSLAERGHRAPAPARSSPPPPGSTAPSSARTCPTSAPTAPAASGTTSSTCATRSPARSGSPRTGRSSSSGSATSATRSRTTPASAAAGFRVVALLDADADRHGEHGRRRRRTALRRPRADRRASTASPSASSPPRRAPPRTSRDRMVAAGISSILNFAPAVLVGARRASTSARSTCRSSCRSSPTTSSARPPGEHAQEDAA